MAKRAHGVAALMVGVLAVDGLWLVRSAHGERRLRPLDIVIHRDERRGVLRAFERVGQHHRDRLAVVGDLIALQHHRGLVVAGGLVGRDEARCVARGHHRDDAGFALDAAEVDIADASLDDREQYT